MSAFLQDEEQPPLRIAADQVESHIDLLLQSRLDLRLSIIKNPTGADGFEVSLIVVVSRCDDGSPFQLAANT